MSDNSAGDNLIGQVIRGYELREMIGIGGFGSVYRAYQAIVDREVAIKIILPEHANNPDFVRRFEREAQFIARLENLHIIPIYDYWRDPGSAYIVMRYLKGGNLLTSLEQGGPWPLAAAATLIDQIGAALSAAHRNGIVHQDLKPENILLDTEQNAYLSDFGIAKDIVTGATDASERYGSPGYASPEQILGHPVTPMSDIYSFSLVIYALLTGTTPYKDENTFTLLRKTVYEPLPSILEKRPDLPPDIDRVLQCASAKDPFARYPDAMSLAADFRRAINLPGTTDTSTWVAIAPQGPSYNNPTTRHYSTRVLGALEMEPVRNPFKGLHAFEESDSKDFFGREALVQKLVKRLQERGLFSRFLAVIGPSGSGKSSVVSAGLLPVIRRGEVEGAERWFITQMMPGDHPLQELEQALLRVAFEAPGLSLVEQMRESDDGLHAALNTLFPLANTEVLIFIDQFEELFSPVVNDHDRTQFLDNLVAALTDPHSRLRAIITLRADFVDRPLLVPGFGELMRERTEFVVPLSNEELEQAILRPAQNAGLALEENLVTDIVADIQEQPGALPLLQFALTELFERRQGKTLTQRAYREIGGVSGALIRRADDLYESLDTAKQAIVRQVFLRLVVLGEGVEDTRRRLLRPELLTIADKEVVAEILDLFGTYRLLTFDNDPATRAPTVEIAHEALIRQWRRLRDWLAASRDDLRLQQRLSMTTGEWVKMERDPSFLAEGARLSQFETLLNSSNIALSANERDYLEASIRLRQRRIRRRQMFITGLAVITLIALVSAVLAFDGQNKALIERDRADIERDRANQQARISDSRRLANSAMTERGRLDYRLLLSLQAFTSYDTTEARASLLNGIFTHSRVQSFLTGHNGTVRSVAVRPNGTLIATGGDDGSVLLWDAETYRRSEIVLQGQESAVISLAFSPDNQQLAAAGNDGKIRLWTLDTPDSPIILNAHTETVWEVAFSPDGQQLASVGKDGKILLWDLTQDEPTFRTILEPDAGERIFQVFAVDFSPDGTLLAAGSEDQQVALWNTETLAQEAVLTGPTNWVTTLDFNATGQYLAASGPESWVYLWDISTFELATSFPTNHRLEVNDVAFSPHALALVTASLDNTLKFWDLSSGQFNSVLLDEHVNAVLSAAFTPDGRTLISASSDGSALVWSLGLLAPPLTTTLRGHTAPVWAAAFSPNSTLLATGSSTNEDGSGAEIRLWRTTEQGSEFLNTLENSTAPVYALDYRDQTLLAGHGDGSVVFWTIDETLGMGTEIARFSHENGVTSAAFRPDGQQAASADISGGVRLWERLSDQKW